MSTILIIDDEPLIHDGYDKLLARESYTLRHATSVDQGLAMLSPEIDLVMCDVVMPDKDGYTACREIRANPAWRTIPIMLVTSLVEESEVVRGLEAGADEFLTKPVSGPVLRSRIAALLRIRARYTELAQRPTLQQLLDARLEEACADSRISPRERDVLRMLLVGKTSEDIGDALGISARTAKFHQANVLKKLGIESRTELLRALL